MRKKIDIHVENIDKATGVPKKLFSDLMEIIKSEIDEHNLKAGTTLSFGNYGYMRLEQNPDAPNQKSYILLDSEDEATNADNFLRRWIVLRGFDYKEDNYFHEALECFDYALEMNQDNEDSDAVLYHARASVKDDIIRSSKSNKDLGQLAIGVFDDLLHSIHLNPDYANAYMDLLVFLDSVKSPENEEEHNKWKSGVAQKALSYKVTEETAKAAQEKLKKFIKKSG
jgi:tetratricopeptide (TPR) repeat protein